jgi:hypothetical protein
MLPGVLKTMPVTKNVPTVEAACTVFDTMGVLPIT